MRYLITTLCFGLALGLSAANAETKAKTDTAKPRSAKSIECSKLADAKGLHGKERKVFRAKCKKGEPTS
jgi:hypothetical protein